MDGNLHQDTGETVLARLYREAKPVQKLAAIARLNQGLIALKEVHLASLHPSWTTDQRRAELRRWWFSARD